MGNQSGEEWRGVKKAKESKKGYLSGKVGTQRSDERKRGGRKVRKKEQNERQKGKERKGAKGKEWKKEEVDTRDETSDETSIKEFFRLSRSNEIMQNVLG